jgi:hypothetical protein
VPTGSGRTLVPTRVQGVAGGRRQDRFPVSQMENRLADGGDSGGPRFSGNTAYGLQEGGMNAGGAKRNIASRADSLHEALFDYSWATT